MGELSNIKSGVSVTNGTVTDNSARLIAFMYKRRSSDLIKLDVKRAIRNLPDISSIPVHSTTGARRAEITRCMENAAVYSSTCKRLALLKISFKASDRAVPKAKIKPSISKSIQVRSEEHT